LRGSLRSGEPLCDGFDSKKCQILRGGWTHEHAFLRK